jgi:hypothetical protein
MIECENYEDFQSGINIIKNKQIINNKAVYTFENINTDILIKNKKIEKTQEMKEKFYESFKDGFLVTLGFKVNCNYKDINNLHILLNQTLENETINFRDFNNNFHSISLLNLQTIIDELENNILNLYQKKWNSIEAIKTATTLEQLENIVW